MATSRPTVLFDATPLRAVSGVRGIGRYIRDLLLGLDSTRADWERDLRIVVASDLALPNRIVLEEDLVRAADEAFRARGSRGPLLAHARRLLLAKAGKLAGADLVFLPEAQGAPIWGDAVTVVTCHDLIPLHYWRQYLGGPVRRALRLARDRSRYRSAALVMCISERTERDLAELIGIPAARRVVVDHGIDLDGFHANADATQDAGVLDALGIGTQRYLVYAGHADWRKNARGMLETLKRVRERHDMVLAWAGTLPNNQRRRLESLARRIGVAGALRFLGFVPEEQMPALFRNATAHLFLSRLEGFGLSIAEAMAVGCPVVVARGSASDEVAGRAGMIVDPDDFEDAARQIARLIEEPEERARRVAAGLERVQRFDRRRMARDYTKVWRELSARAGH